MARAAEAGAGDLAVDLIVFRQQDAEPAGDTEAPGDRFRIVERRGFGAEARPEGRQGHRPEQLGLATELDFGRGHQDDLLAWERRQAGADVVGQIDDGAVEGLFGGGGGGPERFGFVVSRRLHAGRAPESERIGEPLADAGVARDDEKTLPGQVRPRRGDEGRVGFDHDRRGEGRADPDFAGHLHVAVHRLGQAADDREA